MKKYIAFCMAAIMSCAVILSGCSRTETNSTEPQMLLQNFESGVMQGKPEENLPGFAPGNFGEQMPPMAPNDMAENSALTITETIPVTEGNDIFSDRDMVSSPDLSDAVTIAVKNNSEYQITSAGTYVLSGKAENFTVKVEADKEDKVQIVLQDVTVTNEDFSVIYVKSADKCFVTSLGDNSLTVTDAFISDGDINTDAVIFSKDDLTLNGTGNLTILSAAANGISAKDDLKITGGSYNINSAKDGIEANDSISISDGQFIINSNKDAFHCENDEQQGSIYIEGGTFEINAGDDGIQATTTLVVNGGDFTITAVEGMEATYVQINDGIIRINASDDGINAARKSYECDVVIEINGGEITVVMGPGDTDGLDANGTIIVNGGIIDVTGQSTFDADNGSVYNGGTIIINGVEVDSIPSSMMGMGGHGGGKGNHFSGGRPG